MSDYFERVERQIVGRVEAGVPRSARRPAVSGYLAVAASVLVVIAVAGVFLLARGGGGGGTPTPATDAGLNVTFSLAPQASPAALRLTEGVLGARLHAALLAARVSTAGGQIVVSAPAGTRSQILALAAPGRFALYDWEARVLAPNGRAVATQLPSPDPAVLDISQGNGPAAPGSLSAGCVTLQQALALAATAGAGRPRRTEYIGRLKLRVPVGYSVLQASDPGAGHSGDGYFVVRDAPALQGSELANPRVSIAPGTRVPDIQFDFTSAGRRDFQAVTKAIARRGALVSSPGQTLNQHFAIAIDNKLITVPFIDYKQYPEGITGGDGADISGNFTRRTAKDLAILLRYGPLPVVLTATG